MIDQGQITAGHGKALLRVTDENLQLELGNKVIAEELSVRATEALAKKICEDNIKEITKNKNTDNINITFIGSAEKATIPSSAYLTSLCIDHFVVPCSLLFGLYGI